MTDQKRRTQSDVAKEAGVHRTTVALALKNHPSIPEATKQRIREIAARIGYVPDPMLSALAAYRHQLRPATFQGAIAWLTNSIGDYDWRRIGIYREYFEGAKERAGTYGYLLEPFELQAQGMSPNRMASSLRARNIPGILLCPQPRPNMELDFPWDSFSLVMFGYTLMRPQLHTVTATQYRGVIKAIRHVRELGYKRIGYAAPPFHNERTDGNYVAGYLAEEMVAHNRIRIPPFGEKSGQPLASSAMVESRQNPKLFRKWFDKYRPDAIVTPDLHIEEVLSQCGLKAPDDLGVACASLPSKASSLSGVCENSTLIGRAAIDFLVPMIQRGERGVPEVPQRLLCEGVWVKGTTLKAQN